MARHRRGAAEWAALIDEWKQGGLDLPEFCRRRGLSRGTMQGWVYFYCNRSCPPTAPQALRRVEPL